MTFENLLEQLEENILTITINRPDKLNALNKKTLQELDESITRALNDSNIKCIIITGTGNKAFVAGADISEFLGMSAKDGGELASFGQNIFNKLENSSKPVIAAINGFALGGGCELAMACHIRVASENAKFGQPEVKLGLIPGYAGTQRLTQLIGKGKALEYLMTADVISSEEALSLGLINYMVKPEQLLQKCNELAKKINAQAPIAIGAIIKCVNAFYNKDVDGSRFEVEEFSRCFETEDFKEGATAFMEKRKANFIGK